MTGMRLRYSTASILLVIAATAIACGGIQFYRTKLIIPTPDRPLELRYLLSDLLSTSPIWIPIVFLSFAIGRRRLTVWMVIGFAVAEAVSAGIAYWMIPAY